MSIPWDKKFRITLWGVDGEPMALSRPRKRREGVFLEDVPEGLSGLAKEHLWDEASGAWRGTSVTQNTLRFDFVVKSRDVRREVNTLLAKLGDGGRPVGVSITSAEWGYRWYRARLQNVSKVQWFQSPGGSKVAKLSIILEFSGDTTRRFTEKLVLGPSDRFGTIPIRVDGDTDLWPKFTFEGRYSRAKVRLTARDDWQDLPYRAAGWVVDSHPERRHVTDLYGNPDFSVIVPFWPEPVHVMNERGEVQIDVTNPSSGFKCTVEWIPEFSRAW